MRSVCGSTHQNESGNYQIESKLFQGMVTGENSLWPDIVSLVDIALVDMVLVDMARCRANQ